MPTPNYSVDYYISQGMTLYDAEEKVRNNKKRTAEGIILASAKKRLANNNIKDLSVEELLLIEKKFENDFNVTKNNFFKFLNKLIELGYDTRSAISHFMFVCSEVIKTSKRITKTKMFHILLLGENHPDTIKFLNSCRAYASCSFEKFSENYTDKEKALVDFRLKYGSMSIDNIKAKYNCDDLEAKEILAQRVDKIKNSNNNKSPEEKSKINKSKANTLQNYMKRYGEDLGAIKYNEWLHNKKGKGSQEWYIKKYGVAQGKRIYEEKLQNRSYWKIEFWMNKGYSEEDAKTKISEIYSNRPSFSKSYCVEKYGYEKGIKIWKQRQELWQKSLNNRTKAEMDAINKSKGLNREKLIERHGEEKYNEIVANRIKNLLPVSKESIKFFIKLYRILRKTGIIHKKDALLGVKGSSEYFLFKEKNVFFYDFCIPSLNVIIEYHGTAFHPRPNDLQWKPIFSNTTREELLEKDQIKEQLAKDNKFNYFVVWSDADKEATLYDLYHKIYEIYEEKEINNVASYSI